MLINFTNVRFKNFTASAMTIEGDLAPILSSFLSDNSTTAEEPAIVSLHQETDIHTQDFVSSLAEAEQSFVLPIDAPCPLSNEDLIKIIDGSVEPQFDASIWEQYKSSVIGPLLEQLENPLKSDGKLKSKAQIKSEANDKADLRKCMNISLSPKYDSDFIELVYQARVKKYGASPNTFVIDEFVELEPEQALEQTEFSQRRDEVSESCIYILAENVSLVENSHKYTIIKDVLSVPKTSLYCDENGEIGEISYAQLEARHSKPKPVFVKPTDTEFENKMQAIRDSPGYSDQERQNRLRNAQARQNAYTNN